MTDKMTFCDDHAWVGPDGEECPECESTWRHLDSACTPPAAQVQEEKPEVVALRWRVIDPPQNNPGWHLDFRTPVLDGIEEQGLMTVAQHERMTASISAERAMLLETFVVLCDYLGIDPQQARKLPGKPSDVFIAAIEGRAALSAPPAAGVPEGWRLAPEEATSEMIRALWATPGTHEDAYAALLAAAPAPPASEQQQAVAYCDNHVLDQIRNGRGSSVGVTPAQHRREGQNNALYTAPVTEQEDHSASTAAIAFALWVEQEEGEGITFLGMWNDGEFEAIRKEWPNCPDEVFIGADPLFVPSKEPKP
jgi:hypothetical protein